MLPTDDYSLAPIPWKPWCTDADHLTEPRARRLSMRTWSLALALVCGCGGASRSGPAAGGESPAGAGEASAPSAGERTADCVGSSGLRVRFVGLPEGAVAGAMTVACLARFGEDEYGDPLWTIGVGPHAFEPDPASAIERNHDVVSERGELQIMGAAAPWASQLGGTSFGGEGENIYVNAQVGSTTVGILIGIAASAPPGSRDTILGIVRGLVLDTSELRRAEP